MYVSLEKEIFAAGTPAAPNRSKRYCGDVEGLKGHALDCDSTIVRNDRVPPPVLDVIAEARRRKVTVILVTGRILKYPRRAILSI